MSDDFVTFVPLNPNYMPSPAQIGRAVRLATELFPNADSIRTALHDCVQFFHTGGNHDDISCPACGQMITDEWWSDTMSKDWSGECFLLQTFAMPCCNAPSNLNDLQYKWPPAFGRFGLELMNPNVGLVTPEARKIIEAALGISIRTVYMHL